MNKVKILSRTGCLILAGMLTLSGCGSSENKYPSDTSSDITPDVIWTEEELGIFNRAKIEGKFAVYYMSSLLNMDTWQKKIAGGDSMIIITPDGKVILHDCGLHPEGAYVVDKLQKLGVKKIDYFIVSHPHSDHVGGFPMVARYFDIGYIYLPPKDVMARTDVVGLEIMKTIKEKDIPYKHLKSGNEFDLTPDVHVKVYNPKPGFGRDTSINLNESSLLLKFTYKDSSFLFTGDIANNPGGSFGYATETALLKEHGSELRADVMKIGHHGNKDTLSSMDFKKAVSPKITVTISGFARDLGEHNKNLEVGAVALNTGLDGDILVYTDGDGVYEVEVSKERTNKKYESLNTENGHLTVR